MKKRLLGAAALALASVSALADDLRFTYVDAGLFGGDSGYCDDCDWADEVDTDIAQFRVRGSWGIGEHMYVPVMLESQSLDVTVRAFDSIDDFTVNTLLQSVGFGGRLNPMPNMAFYGDVSIAFEQISLDEDGGYDDSDDDADGVGHILRAGWRFQPTSRLTLNIELQRRKVKLDDHWDDVTETQNRRLVAAQFNFTPAIGAGLEFHRDTMKYDTGFDYDNDMWGAYFRYSFK